MTKTQQEVKHPEDVLREQLIFQMTGTENLQRGEMEAFVRSFVLVSPENKSPALD